MNLGSKNRFQAMLVIWGYDMAKFLVLYRTMEGYGINPWIFFFLDMVTVPTYVMGWSLMTFVSSTAPYFYAAFVGHRAFPPEIWCFLALILLFSLINLIRKILRAKKVFAD